MIQFSKPRRPYDRNANANRFEHSARDMLSVNGNGDCTSLNVLGMRVLADKPSINAARGGSVPSRFDSTFFRTHDAIGSIPSDAQSVRSQATYSSGLPTFSQSSHSGYPSSVKRGASTYASSTFSQDLLSSDSQSVRDDASSIAGGGVGGSSIAYSQADRIRRASLSLSDAPSSFLQDGSNWRDDDDARSSYTTSQAGMTDY